MRRLCLIVLVSVLTVPAAAVAASQVANGGSAAGVSRAVGDGSLAVAGASGTIIVAGKGLIFGHFDEGTLTVLDYKSDDPTATLSVTGAKLKVNQGLSVYSGSDVRFLLPSGRYTVRLVGTGIDASAVGVGYVGTIPLGTADDGTFAVNGGKPQPLAKGAAGQSFGGK
jgi:hypothetical protein